MIRYIITIVLLFVTAVANYAFLRPEDKIPRRSLSKFPTVIGNWKSLGDQLIDDASMQVLRVDDYIMRNYINPDGGIIGLYIGYFETQRKGKQVHSPRQCLPGAGWSTASQKILPLKLKNHNPLEASINYYLMEKGSQRQLYLWWYQRRSRIYASEYLNKFYMMEDAIIRRRTDGALVRINMVTKGKVEKTLETELSFIDHIIPILGEYIPN